MQNIFLSVIILGYISHKHSMYLLMVAETVSCSETWFHTVFMCIICIFFVTIDTCWINGKHWILSQSMLPWLVYAQSRSGPARTFLLRWSWTCTLCMLNPCLDLETLPQMSQGWERPEIWNASMWCGICFNGPCFPHTLQEAILPWPLLVLASLLVIIDLICSSRSL